MVAGNQYNVLEITHYFLAVPKLAQVNGADRNRTEVYKHKAKMFDGCYMTSGVDITKYKRVMLLKLLNTGHPRVTCQTTRHDSPTHSKQTHMLSPLLIWLPFTVPENIQPPEGGTVMR